MAAVQKDSGFQPIRLEHERFFEAFSQNRLDAGLSIGAMRSDASSHPRHGLAHRIEIALWQPLVEFAIERGFDGLDFTARPPSTIINSGAVSIAHVVLAV